MADVLLAFMSPLLSIQILKQGLIAKRLSVLEALVIKVDENIHPWLLKHMCTVDSVQNTVYTCAVEQPPALNNYKLFFFLTFN